MLKLAMREPFFQQGNTHQPFMGCADTGVDITGLQENRLITSNQTEHLRTCISVCYSEKTVTPARYFYPFSQEQNEIHAAHWLHFNYHSRMCWNIKDK